MRTISRKWMLVLCIIAVVLGCQYVMMANTLRKEA